MPFGTEDDTVEASRWSLPSARDGGEEGRALNNQEGFTLASAATLCPNSHHLSESRLSSGLGSCSPVEDGALFSHRTSRGNLRQTEGSHFVPTYQRAEGLTGVCEEGSAASSPSRAGVSLAALLSSGPCAWEEGARDCPPRMTRPWGNYRVLRQWQESKELILLELSCVRM